MPVAVLRSPPKGEPGVAGSTKSYTGIAPLLLLWVYIHARCVKRSITVPVDPKANYSTDVNLQRRDARPPLHIACRDLRVPWAEFGFLRADLGVKQTTTERCLGVFVQT